MVVENYIDTAAPVSSNTLSKSNELSVSSATIRNDLATLEHEGYITHMHTSSGRVPCDLGYRHYVKAIMSEESLSFKERLTIEHQMFQVQGNIDSRLAITASTLSSIIGNVVLITKKQEIAKLNDIKIFDVFSRLRSPTSRRSKFRDREQVGCSRSLPGEAALPAYLIKPLLLYAIFCMFWLRYSIFPPKRLNPFRQP